MWLWVIGWGLLGTWLVGVLLGKGGFIHILLFCATAILLVQWLATRPAIED
jgi:hypothetical protein